MRQPADAPMASPGSAAITAYRAASSRCSATPVSRLNTSRPSSVPNAMPRPLNPIAANRPGARRWICRILVLRHADPSRDRVIPCQIPNLGKHVTEPPAALGGERSTAVAERRTIDAHVQSPVRTGADARITGAARIAQRLATRQHRTAQIVSQWRADQLIGP